MFSLYIKLCKPPSAHLSLSELVMLSQTLSSSGYCKLTCCSVTYTRGDTVVHCVKAEPVERAEQLRLFLWTLELKGLSRNLRFGLQSLTDTLM